MKQVPFELKLKKFDGTILKVESIKLIPEPEIKNQGRFYLFKDLFDFIRYNKKWWLIPIIILLLLSGLVIIVGQANSSVSPFIYVLF